MKTLPTGLQAHLDSGCTTMCYCWRIRRRDSITMGFTEHDENLTFDNTTFEAQTGFTASMAQQSLGLSVDNMELISAFDSDHITETDLIGGVYDDASIEIFWVNWQDVTQRVIVLAGSVGEVTQNGVQFTAEMRSLTHRLNQKLGRVYSRDSDRDGVDTSTQISSIVSRVITRSLFEITNGVETNDYYNRGVIKWLSGNNNNFVFDIKTYSFSESVKTVMLWDQTVKDIQVGDWLNITAAWPRTAEEHIARYGNLIDFRGFPHMPGKDIVTIYAERGGENQQGGALVF